MGFTIIIRILSWYVDKDDITGVEVEGHGERVSFKRLRDVDRSDFCGVRDDVVNGVNDIDSTVNRLTAFSITVLLGIGVGVTITARAAVVTIT